MTAAETWATDFFAGTFVDIWLRAMPEATTREETDFLVKTLRLTAGASVLDLCCGGGRHCLELAGLGYRTTGVDISADFLAHARPAADERQLAVIWEQRPVHDLPWRDTFDSAYCMGNSLGGLDDDAFAAFLKGVAAALKPGGRFVIDHAGIAESLLPQLKDRIWY